MAGRAFCDASTIGISDKDLAFLMHKAISISSFSLTNGDPNQALNEKHQLYFLHFKPTGQVVGSLFEKCITRNKKSNFVPRPFGFFLGHKPANQVGSALCSIASPGSGVSSSFSIKKARQVRQQAPVPAAGSRAGGTALRVNTGWNCQDLKAGS